MLIDNDDSSFLDQSVVELENASGSSSQDSCVQFLGWLVMVVGDFKIYQVIRIPKMFVIRLKNRVKIIFLYKNKMSVFIPVKKIIVVHTKSSAHRKV